MTLQELHDDTHVLEAEVTSVRVEERKLPFQGTSQAWLDVFIKGSGKIPPGPVPGYRMPFGSAWICLEQALC